MARLVYRDMCETRLVRRGTWGELASEIMRLGYLLEAEVQYSNGGESLTWRSPADQYGRYIISD